MSHDMVRRAFVTFHMTLGAVVIIQGVATAAQAIGSQPAPHWHLVILATIETLAAVFFLVPFTVRVAGLVLCLVFIFAFSVHAIIGEFELGLLVYLAGTFFVVVHGGVFERESKQIPA